MAAAVSVGMVRHRHKVYRRHLYDAYLDAQRASYSRGGRGEPEEEAYRAELLQEYQREAKRDRALETVEADRLKRDQRRAAMDRRRRRDRERYQRRVAQGAV